MNRKIVAIHQPNFFPWLGYFDKINRSDVFILMDNVQFPKTGRGTWSNRVKVLICGQPAWITMPVVRNHLTNGLISEIQINDATNWRSKLLKTLQMNYGKSPFFSPTIQVIEKLIMNPEIRLTDYNIAAIRACCQLLDIDIGKLMVGSKIDAKGKATDLLISMTKAVYGTAYMCGGGASGYQDDDKFSVAGIDLLYQNFNHPEYTQYRINRFVPGLSIIDALMNIGVEGTKGLLSAARGETRGHS